MQANRLAASSEPDGALLNRPTGKLAEGASWAESSPESQTAGNINDQQDLVPDDVQHAAIGKDLDVAAALEATAWQEAGTQPGAAQDSWDAAVEQAVLDEAVLDNAVIDQPVLDEDAASGQPQQMVAQPHAVSDGLTAEGDTATGLDDGGGLNSQADAQARPADNYTSRPDPQTSSSEVPNDSKAGIVTEDVTHTDGPEHGCSIPGTQPGIHGSSTRLENSDPGNVPSEPVIEPTVPARSAAMRGPEGCSAGTTSAQAATQDIASTSAPSNIAVQHGLTDGFASGMPQEFQLPHSPTTRHSTATGTFAHGAAAAIDSQSAGAAQAMHAAAVTQSKHHSSRCLEPCN